MGVRGGTRIALVVHTAAGRAAVPTAAPTAVTRASPGDGHTPAPIPLTRVPTRSHTRGLTHIGKKYPCVSHMPEVCVPDVGAGKGRDTALRGFICNR